MSVKFYQIVQGDDGLFFARQMVTDCTGDSVGVVWVSETTYGEWRDAVYAIARHAAEEAAASQEGK